MPADTNSAAPSSSMVPGSDNTTTVSGGSAANAPTQVSQTNASQSQGSGYSAQAADIAGTDERPGADGGRGAPRHDSPDDNEMSAEDLRALVKSLRAEAAAGRKAKQELDARQRAEEDAKLSETEKLQKERAEALAQVEILRREKQEVLILSESRSVARELGLNPDKAHKLIDYNAITYTDDGIPTNISELITKALEELGLMPAATSSAGPSNPSNPNAARMSGVPAAAAPYQQGRPPAPPVPATGATNPPRGAGAQQPLVRSLNGITWKRGQ